MKKLFVIAVAFAVALLVGGPALVSMAAAGTDTANAGASVSNNAVFLALTGAFTTSLSIAATDVEAGCITVGNVHINVDSTSAYSTSITSAAGTGTTTANPTSSTSSISDPFRLDDVTLTCAADGGNPGSTGLANADLAADGGLSAGAVTSGDATGYDADIFAAIFFAGANARFTDAPNGTYDFTVTVLISDV